MISQKEYWERKSLQKRRSPKHPVVEAFAKPKINYIKKYIKFSKETTLLDVGCGNGFFSYHFSRLCDVTGTDFSRQMLVINPITKKFLANAEKLPFEDNSFDVVFCSNLLHHLKNVEKCISEMVRVSKKYIIVSEPNRNNPFLFIFSAIVKEERKGLKFSLNYLKNMLRRRGLNIISSISTGMIFPNKTPTFLLPLLNLFNFNFPFGSFNIIITKKMIFKKDA